jgi:hypothetical protein
MFKKRRIKFPIVELFTLAVVSCATLIVLYPGGDRIALTWLTGQEPAIESYFLSEPNSESLTKKSSPSASELLRREKSKPWFVPSSSKEQFPALPDLQDPSQDVEMTPRLESLAPVDSKPHPPGNEGIQIPDERLTASQIGFLRTPEAVESNSDQFQFENLPSFDEPMADDLIVRDFEILKPAGDSFNGPVTRKDARPLSQATEDSIAWSSEVSDEMVVESNKLQQSAGSLDSRRPTGKDQPRGGGDFLPRTTPADRSKPADRLEPTLPPQSHLEPQRTNQRIANQLEMGADNPLR